ncbi:hypothetical protein HBH92_055110 [Parastagonospora nodorum]|nr:hypothetical protein HBI95_173990 [Parastagonospora nodorum]KAH4418104.1 hypothetical protein HBH92_055110 [Parastagonospora nodorum]KAH4449640.1 hypothetical protein HBH93_033960 [Parastagonospora nodorum]KAH4463490.1 hypothetical protein HBH91_051170 [Parastagonospora nodorum]KAH4506781.1 hypothetical protein HBH89_081190 [Parastagonospora nodorum]
MTIDNEQGAAHLRRSLVLRNVLDTEREDPCKQTADAETVSSTAYPNPNLGASEDLGNDVDSLIPGSNLEEIREWLDLQCGEEQARIDWSVPRITLTDDQRKLKRGLNTDVLKRIKKGYGPRPSKFEDLLWPLRMNDDVAKFLTKPIIETPQEMEHVLRNWNRHVGVPVEDADAREVLIATMYARIKYLNGSLSYRRSADAHDITSQKLLHAVHAYRLETVHFSTTDTCELMTIILAHLGYAIPDIDQDLKYLLFYTLVSERQFLAHTANATTAHRLEQQITAAKRMRDHETVDKYSRQMNNWATTIWLNNCTIIADRVRLARRNVQSRALGELQHLTILQTAQKIVLRQRISRGAPPSDKLIPREIWLPEHSLACDNALTALNEAADDHLSEFLASLRVATSNINGMHNVAHARILTRAIKFAGLDLPQDMSEGQRLGIVNARLEHAGTMNMISDAVEAITETKVKSREMVDVIGNMDGKFGDVLDAVEVVGKEFEDLVMLLDGEPAVDGWGEEWEDSEGEGGGS